MRYVVLCCVLATSTLACSQITIISGFATNYAAVPGAYAAPFVPRLVTPEAVFATPPLQVGAENATAGNVVGVSSLVSGQPSPAFEVKAHTTPGLNLGAAIPESAYGVAQLAKGYSVPPARRKFTNDDIERLKKDDAQR
jgi:hypothetical protein